MKKLEPLLRATRDAVSAAVAAPAPASDAERALLSLWPRCPAGVVSFGTAVVAAGDRYAALKEARAARIDSELSVHARRQTAAAAELKDALARDIDTAIALLALATTQQKACSTAVAVTQQSEQGQEQQGRLWGISFAPRFEAFRAAQSVAIDDDLAPLEAAAQEYHAAVAALDAATAEHGIPRAPWELRYHTMTAHAPHESSTSARGRSRGGSSPVARDADISDAADVCGGCGVTIQKAGKDDTKGVVRYRCFVCVAGCLCVDCYTNATLVLEMLANFEAAMHSSSVSGAPDSATSSSGISGQEGPEGVRRWIEREVQLLHDAVPHLAPPCTRHALIPETTVFYRQRLIKVSRADPMTEKARALFQSYGPRRCFGLPTVLPTNGIDGAAATGEPTLRWFTYEQVGHVVATIAGAVISAEGPPAHSGAWPRLGLYIASRPVFLCTEVAAVCARRCAVGVDTSRDAEVAIDALLTAGCASVVVDTTTAGPIVAALTRRVEEAPDQCPLRRVYVVDSPHPWDGTVAPEARAIGSETSLQCWVEQQSSTIAIHVVTPLAGRDPHTFGPMAKLRADDNDSSPESDEEDLVVPMMKTCDLPLPPRATADEIEAEISATAQGADLSEEQKKQLAEETTNPYVVGVFSSGTTGGAPKGVFLRSRAFIDDVDIRWYRHPLATALVYTPCWMTGKGLAWRSLLNGASMAILPHPCADHWTWLALSRPTAGASFVPSMLITLYDRHQEALSFALRAPEGTQLRIEREDGVVIHSPPLPAVVDPSDGVSPDGEAAHSAAAQVRLAWAHAYAAAATHAATGYQQGRVGCGGAAVPRAALQTLRAVLPLTFVESYGTTEAGGIGSCDTEDGYLRPFPGVSLALRDRPDLGFTRFDLPHPRGELLVTNAAAVGARDGIGRGTDGLHDAAGRLCTGDIVELPPRSDPDDFSRFRVVGRAGDMQKLPNGTFFAPGAVESALSTVQGGHWCVLLTADRGAVVAVHEGPFARSASDAEVVAQCRDACVTAGVSAVPIAVIADTCVCDDDDDGHDTPTDETTSPHVGAPGMWRRVGCLTMSNKLLRVKVAARPTVASGLLAVDAAAAEAPSSRPGLGSPEAEEGTQITEDAVRAWADSIAVSCGFRRDAATAGPMRDVGFDSVCLARVRQMVRRRLPLFQLPPDAPNTTVLQLVTRALKDHGRTVVSSTAAVDSTNGEDDVEAVPPHQESNKSIRAETAAADDLAVTTAEAEYRARVLAADGPVFRDPEEALKPLFYDAETDVDGVNNGDENPNATRGVAPSSIQREGSDATTNDGTPTPWVFPPSIVKCEEWMQDFVTATIVPAAGTIPRGAPRTTSEMNGTEGGVHVVLTGATGFVGRHTLGALLRRDTVARVTCLTRSTKDEAARDRVTAGLARSVQGQIESELASATLSEHAMRKLRVVDCDLGLELCGYRTVAEMAAAILHTPTLAASKNDNTCIADERTVVIHCAANVVSTADESEAVLKMAPANCGGTANVAALCAAFSPPLPLHYVSTVSVEPRGTDPGEVPVPPHRLNVYASLAEAITASPRDLSHYARTKLIGEGICAAASKRCGVPLSVSRLGLMTFSSASDVNDTDWLVRLIASCAQVRMTPDPVESGMVYACHYAPVDVAASCIAAAADDMASTPLISQRGENDASYTVPTTQSRAPPSYVPVPSRVLYPSDCLLEVQRVLDASSSAAPYERASSDHAVKAGVPPQCFAAACRAVVPPPPYLPLLADLTEAGASAVAASQAIHTERSKAERAVRWKTLRSSETGDDVEWTAFKQHMRRFVELRLQE